MKRYLLLFMLCAVNGNAETFTDDLATKRNVLIWYMRDLGPLAPDNWLAGPMIYAANSEPCAGDFEYHPMGNFAYTGHFGTEYYFSYNSVGAWSPTYPAKYAYNLTFASFGLHEAEVQPYPGYYHFAMDTVGYNIAGLKYEGLEIITGIDSGGYLLGYGITPGVSFFTSDVYNPLKTFDILQKVETPTFQISDYYFGNYLNYPVDVKMPTPQKTQSQNIGAFLANGVGTTNLLIAWVKEGVYRPGYALQPGYSSPRLYTYMQQYFDGPWETDMAAGTIPRLSTANWNGIGKINTSSAVRTGTLSPTGRFIPDDFGKQIIVTRPMENGFYGELPFYAIQLLVDKNRDGVLNKTDVTTATDPHVFWVNNDCDRSVYTEDDLWDEDEAAITGSRTSDADFVMSKFRIPSMRDLEDYDRLHVRGLKELCRDLPTGQGYSIVFRWKTILSGNPGIFVFKAADSNGGAGYLTNVTSAADQIFPTLYPTNYTEPGASTLAVGRVLSGVSPVLHNDSARGTTDYFIYCATSGGVGELAVSLYKGIDLIGESSVFLDLRDVKELYERWTLGDSNGGTPATNPSIVSEGLPAGLTATQFNDGTSSGQRYILLVHGWNMAPLDKDNFAETSFKRLYWQGYTNRFGSLRWPTTYGFTGSVKDIIIDAHNYDNGEYTAWRSSEGLRLHLLNLNQRYPNKTYLVAHSMGNVVAGEALALNAEKYNGGQIVNTYVATQAAIPLNCYNQSIIPSYSINFLYTPANFLDNYVSVNWDSRTFNVYPGWLATNVVSCGARINFYNPHDYALSKDLWQFNQVLKPDHTTNGMYSCFNFKQTLLPNLTLGSSGAPTPIIPSPARRGSSPSAFRMMSDVFCRVSSSELRWFDFEYNLNDMYEVMSYASEARTMPIGIVPDGLGKQVDIRLFWPSDSEPSLDNGNYGRHKWHSAEFRSNNTSQNGYWSNLLGKNGFGIFLDR